MPRLAHPLIRTASICLSVRPLAWIPFASTVVIPSQVGITLTYEGGTENGGHENLWSFALEGGLPLAVLKGLNSFTAFEVLDVPRKTSGSWLTTLSLGFTVLVLTTGYTAVVTTTLMQQSQVGVTDMEGAIKNGYSFCAEKVVWNTLIARYPKIQNLLVDTPPGSDFMTEQLEAMDAGVCRAAIIYQVMLPSLFQISPNHVPISSSLHLPISSLHLLSSSLLFIPSPHLFSSSPLLSSPLLSSSGPMVHRTHQQHRTLRHQSSPPRDGRVRACRLTHQQKHPPGDVLPLPRERCRWRVRKALDQVLPQLHQERLRRTRRRR